ncbi:MAG: cation transporter [Fibrobacter sp.]|nr:cation transporter [Fibrobacter sp.]
MTTTEVPDTLKESRESKINKTINLGLFANIFLAILKIIIGIVGNSRALLADGINSTSDVVNYIVVKIFASLAEKPADPEHPYGHQQMESISAVVVGAFIITTAVTIFWDSINRVYELLTKDITQNHEHAWITLATAFFTVVLKIFLFSFTKKIGKKTANTAVLALSYDHRNDVFASLGVAAGIVLNEIGFAWADPLAGALVALAILRTGIEILRESSDELMDTVPGDLLDKQIRQTLAPVEGIRRIEEISAHRFGPYLVINITIGVDGEIPVRKGDAIATEVEKMLFRNIALVRRVYVHYHPERAQA